MNTSVTGAARHGGLQCNITDMLGWFLQIILAAIAFACLTCKLQNDLLWILCMTLILMGIS
jgi:hypothetical protein